MKQITTKKELEKLLNVIVYTNNTCWKIGGCEYDDPNFSDIITRAINHEDYILKNYVKIKTYKETYINIPKLEDILSEMLGDYSISEKIEIEFKSMMDKFLDKHKIKDIYLDKVEYKLIDTYNIKPLIKSILEDRKR